MYKRLKTRIKICSVLSSTIPCSCNLLFEPWTLSSTLNLLYSRLLKFVWSLSIGTLQWKLKKPFTYHLCLIRHWLLPMLSEELSNFVSKKFFSRVWGSREGREEVFKVQPCYYLLRRITYLLYWYIRSKTLFLKQSSIHIRY